MAFDLTYWLRKTPQPVAVLADDKRIEVPKNGRAWRDLTQTIKSLEPSKLTCLDGQGNVIRAHVFEAAEDDKAAHTPEMSDVQLFAKLIAEAYDKGASKMQPIIDGAMAFVERGGQRLAKAEAENDRLRGQIHRLNMEIARLSNLPEPAAEDGGVLGAIVAGMAQAAGGSNPLAVVAGKGVAKK